MLNRFAISLLLTALLISGCESREIIQLPDISAIAAPKAQQGAAQRDVAPSATARPLSQSVEYDKYLISGYVRQYVKPNEELYSRVFSAVEAYQPTVDVSDMAVSLDDVIAVNRALLERYEFNYIRSVSLSADSSQITLTYSADEQTAQRSVEAFRSRVESILEKTVVRNSTALERALGIYIYLSSHTQNRLQNSGGGAYDAIVNGWALNSGFANALQYLFDQAEIESHVTYSDDGSHVWNTVNIEGNYYHIDCTMESSQSSGADLYYFGMTDSRRKMSGGFQSWYCGNAKYSSYNAPECSDPRFDFLLCASNIEFDPTAHALYFTDVISKSRLCYSTTSGMISAVAAAEAPQL